MVERHSRKRRRSGRVQPACTQQPAGVREQALLKRAAGRAFCVGTLKKAVKGLPSQTRETVERRDVEAFSTCSMSILEAAGTWTAASSPRSKNGQNPKTTNRDAGESSVIFGEILEAAGKTS